MDFNEAYEKLESKFTSGNSIPVERNTITREEWDAIKEQIEFYRKTINDLKELYRNFLDIHKKGE